MNIEIRDTKTHKHLISENYNFSFDKKTGMFKRWGKTIDEDPQVGIPEIADIEITTICHGPGGKYTCECYKLNSDKGVNMTIDTYTKILDKLCKSIGQVALGGDSDLKANPDIWKIMEKTREYDIVPNITVADVDDETADKLAKYVGATAVSRYPDKNLCYDSVKRLTDRGMDQVNIHLVLSEKNFDMALETIADVKNDPRLAKLNAIVFLSLKQKGRGVKAERLSLPKYREVIEFAMESGIGFGFDSCGAHKFLGAIKGHPHYKQLEASVEPCESSLFSTYIDVEGKFHPCSFAPNTETWGEEGIDVLECEDFLKDVWFHERTVNFRNTLLKGERNCPLYTI